MLRPRSHEAALLHSVSPQTAHSRPECSLQARLLSAGLSAQSVTRHVLVACSCVQFEAMKQMQERRRDPAAFEVTINQRRNLERAQQAAAAGNLPPGWGSAEDPSSGDTYYYEKETMATQWEPPIEQMVAIIEEQQRAEMNAIVDQVKEKVASETEA